MTWEEVFNVIIAALGAIGTSAAIIFACSNWLGKVWASRILEKEKALLNKELEKVKKDLDIYKEKHLKNHNDKIAIYRNVVEVVSGILAQYDSSQYNINNQKSKQNFDSFNENRLKVYGYLVMLAPQDVINSYDNLIDLLIDIHEEKTKYNWLTIRKKALLFLNEVRKDIDESSGPIQYLGNR